MIYTRRKELGLTLEEIAKHVGVVKGTVQKWESGYIKNMKRDKMALLAEILQIPPTDLLFDDARDLTFSDTPQLSGTEEELLSKFRQLDAQNQEDVMDYVDLRLAKYEKSAKKDVKSCG